MTGLKFGKYSFCCRFKSDALLPPYKGSTFRGVFGRALKKTVCVLKRAACADCLVRKNCIYLYIFEAQKLPTSIKHHRMASPPHPFVIEPPDETRTRYNPGQPFSFNLILFGKANDYLPYFIYAIDRMGNIGIGQAINNRRGKFSLESVHHDQTQIYSGKTKILNTPESIPDLALALTAPENNVCRLTVSLKTPLRLKFNNKLNADLPFHVLIRACLRRISALFEYHGSGEPALDYKGLVQKAQDIQTKESNLRWFDWKRYSARQEQKMLMGGIVGDVTYEGDLGKYVPIINCVRKLHIGKQTAFGLGKLTAESYKTA